MKAHKPENNDTQTRIALLEQSQEHTIQTLNDIRYQIHTMSNELKSEIKDLRKEMNERFDKMDNKFTIVESRFQRIEGRIYQVMFLFCSSVVGYVLAKMYHLI